MYAFLLKAAFFGHLHFEKNKLFEFFAETIFPTGTVL